MEEIDRVAVAAVRAALGKVDLLVLDEIGAMELFSKAFRRTVMQALDSHTPILGTLQRSQIPFLDRLRVRPDIRVVEITESNRDSMRKDLAEEVGRILSFAKKARAG